MCDVDEMDPGTSRYVPPCGYTWKCYNNGLPQECSATCGLSCIAPDAGTALPDGFTGVYQREIKCTNANHTEAASPDMCTGSKPANYCTDSSGCTAAWRCGVGKAVCESADTTTAFPVVNVPCFRYHITMQRPVGCYRTDSNGVMTSVDEAVCAAEAGPKPATTKTVPKCTYSYKCYTDGVAYDCASTSAFQCVKPANSIDIPNCYTGEYDREVKCVDQFYRDGYTNCTIYYSSAPSNKCSVTSGCNAAAWRCGTSKTLCSRSDMAIGFPDVSNTCSTENEFVERPVGCYRTDSYGVMTLVADAACVTEAGPKPATTKALPECTHTWKCYSGGVAHDCASTTAFQCVKPADAIDITDCYTGTYDRQVKCTDQRHRDAADSTKCIDAAPSSQCSVTNGCTTMTWRCGTDMTVCDDADMTTGFPVVDMPCKPEETTLDRLVGCYGTDSYGFMTPLEDAVCADATGPKPSMSKTVPQCHFTYVCVRTGTADSAIASVVDLSCDNDNHFLSDSERLCFKDKQFTRRRVCYDADVDLISTNEDADCGSSKPADTRTLTNETDCTYKSYCAATGHTDFTNAATTAGVTECAADDTTTAMGPCTIISKRAEHSRAVKCVSELGTPADDAKCGLMPVTAVSCTPVTSLTVTPLDGAFVVE